MIIRLALGVIGALTLPAVLGNLTSTRLHETYGTAPVGEATLGLLIHRGIVVTLVGALLVASAIWPALRPGAVPLAIAMKAAFVVVIATQAPETQRRILYFDAASIVVLSAIGVAMIFDHLDDSAAA